MRAPIIGAGGAKPPPALRGRVTSVDGQPIRDAFVMFGADSPQHNDIGQVTDHDGKFFYPTLTPGIYTLIIRGPDGDMAEARADVPHGSAHELLIILGDDSTVTDDMPP